MNLLRLLPGLALLGQISVFGATRTVTSLDDSGPGSLRAQIAAAASGDTINFSVTGTIVLTSDTLTINKNLTVTGPGATALTIQNSNNFTACTVESGGVTFSDLRFRCTAGSAIWNKANVTVNNAIITAKGGIFSQGTIRLENCTFVDCTGEEVAALSVYGSPTIILNCTFHRNRATAIGGAVMTVVSDFNDGTRNTTIRYCTFSRNTAPAAGALIKNRAETFRDFGTGTSNLTLENCTLAENAGQAILNTGTGYQRVTLRSCTVAQDNGSTAMIVTSGDSSSFTLANTILKRDGSGVVLAGTGPFTSQGYNLCNDDGSGKLTGPGDRINADPGLDPYGLLYHGGYTETIAVVDGSPAIDQGKSFGLVSDQRGFLRPMDNPQIPSAPGGDGSDIGAFESGYVARQAGFPSLVVTTTDDHDDGVASAADTTLREAVRTANEFGPVNAITFAPSVTGTLPLLGAIAELVVSDSLTITGPGARTLSVSGGTGRILRVTNGVVSVSGLTLKNSTNDPSSTPGETVQGGAVFNAGDLRFADCTFADNVVKGTGATNFGGHGGAGQGGAVYNVKFLRMERCTFARNQALGGRGAHGLGTIADGGNGAGGEGGAIFNAAPASLVAINCTFQGNTAVGGEGGSADDPGSGGQATAAIHTLGTAAITHCTISGNFASGGLGGLVDPRDPDGRRASSGWVTGGLFAAAGIPQLRNSLCAANTATSTPTRTSIDVRGSFSGTYNLIGSADDSSGLTGGVGNQTGTDAALIDPKLGSLQTNGGPTDTLTLLTGSPAIDKAAFQVSTDQIGTSRPLDSPFYPNAQDGDGTDIGAVEVDAPQPGPVFIVTTISDHNDGTASSLDCSLREAIIASNAAGGSNTIVFKPGLTGAIVLQLGTMQITDSVTITGPGARLLEVDGNSSVRILEVNAGTNTITGLTFRRGRRSSGLVGVTRLAGAINNSATLTVSDCGFTDNAAVGPNSSSTNRPGESATGGAIANTVPGVLSLIRCTFANNSATAGEGEGGFSGTGSNGGSARGGAIFNRAGAALTVESCTFHNNAATGGRGGDAFSDGNGGDAFGGAIFSEGSLTVTSATISGNRVTRGTGAPNGAGRGAGIFTSAAGVTVKNTICAGNLATGGSNPDADGTFVSGGYNLVGNAAGSTGFTATGDQAGSSAALLNPMLGPLANNGGPTDTLLPLEGSPARDRGHSFALSFDQRGHLRIADSSAIPNAAAGDGADIGAVEYRPLGGVDTDGDGMSDEFERFYGFDPNNGTDGGLDTDGDGGTNAQECIAATDPRDRASSLRIISVQRNGGDVRIEFGPAVPGRIYRLVHNPALQGSWQFLRELSPPFTGNEVFRHSPDFQAKSFYRIEAVRPP